MYDIVFMPGEFLSTLSLRRATWPGLLARPFFIISIHALLAESDSRAETIATKVSYFYPRSPCGERPVELTTLVNKLFISIHALLAESDVAQGAIVGYKMNFYPRSPCGERLQSMAVIPILRDFYPRSPCGERLRVLDGSKSSIEISIHALLAESDKISPHSAPDNGNFYPRSPCGERRVHYDNYNLHCVISIHALLAESDRNGLAMRWNTCISIHALLAESDTLFLSFRAAVGYFYPRSPCGERPT